MTLDPGDCLFVSKGQARRTSHLGAYLGRHVTPVSPKEFIETSPAHRHLIIDGEIGARTAQIAAAHPDAELATWAYERGFLVGCRELSRWRVELLSDDDRTPVQVLFCGPSEQPAMSTVPGLSVAELDWWTQMPTADQIADKVVLTCRHVPVELAARAAQIVAVQLVGAPAHAIESVVRYRVHPREEE